MNAGVRATSDDLAAITESLTKAFVDDPVFIYLMGGKFDPRRAKLAFEMLGRNMLQHGMVFTSPNRHGASFWAPPGKWKMPIWSVIKTLGLSLRAYRWGLFRALAVLGRMEKLHPRAAHYYLEVLGTDPAYQGRGIGGALMKEVLAMADAQGVGAYLESSKDTNVPYYQRFGFEVIGEIHHPKGPTMWRMWRNPR